MSACEALTPATQYESSAASPGAEKRPHNRVACRRITGWDAGGAPVGVQRGAYTLSRQQRGDLATPDQIDVRRTASDTIDVVPQMV